MCVPNACPAGGVLAGSSDRSCSGRARVPNVACAEEQEVKEGAFLLYAERFQRASTHQDWKHLMRMSKRIHGKREMDT